MRTPDQIQKDIIKAEDDYHLAHMRCDSKAEYDAYNRLYTLRQELRVSQSQQLAFANSVFQSAPITSTQYNTPNYMQPQSLYNAAQQRMLTPKAPKPRPLPISTRFGEIEAHRMWGVSEQGLLRSGFMQDIFWLPNEPMEGIIKDEHSAGSGEGIHAFKQREQAEAACFDYRQQTAPDLSDPLGQFSTRGHKIFAIGTVLLWGDVIEHSLGYRATRASVKSIESVFQFDPPPLSVGDYSDEPKMSSFLTIHDKSGTRHWVYPREDLLEKVQKRYVK